MAQKSTKGKRPPTKAQIAAENYRKAAVILKRKGIAFEGVDFRKTKTLNDKQRKIVREFLPVLTGEGAIVRLPPDKVEIYRGDSDVIRAGKDYLIVRNEANTVKTYRRGARTALSPLSDGRTMERITLPAKVRSPMAILDFIESGKLDAYKTGREYFGFRFQGFASFRAFPNSQAMFDYLSRYLDGREEDEEPIAIELFRTYPPGAWERMARQEAKDREEPQAKARKARRKERRRVSREMAQARRALPPPKSADQIAAEKQARVDKRNETRRQNWVNITPEERERRAARERYRRARKKSQK